MTRPLPTTSPIEKGQIQMTSTRPHRRRWARAVAVLLLAGAVGACTGSDTGHSDPRIDAKHKPVDDPHG